MPAPPGLPSGCPSGILCVDGIPKPIGFPIQNFRYFNQPIEQIPGWNQAQSQILVHPNNGGLMWKTVECTDVITCIRLESSGLFIDCRNIMTVSLQDSKLCRFIDVTGCPPSGA